MQRPVGMIAMYRGLLLAALLFLGSALKQSQLPARRQHKRGALTATKSKTLSGGADKSVEEILTSVAGILTALEAEEKAVGAKAKASARACKKDAKQLGELMKKGDKTVSEASDDLEKKTAEAEELRTETAGTKDKIQALDIEIDGLVERLAKLRAEHRQQRSRARSSLGQLQATIDQGKLRGRAERNREYRLGRQRDGQVKVLGELRDRLLSSDTKGPVAFLQASAARRSRRRRDDADVEQLQEDRKRLKQAAADADKTFDEEEKELIDLIELKREELHRAEARLRERQPGLADVLKQVSEINRTLGGALRSGARDKSMLQESKEKCALTSSIWEQESKLRSQLTGSLKMAQVFLEKMDTVGFLAKDMEGFRTVQASPPAPLSQPVWPPVFLQEAAVTSVTTDSQSASESKITSTGAFDEVNRMIQALITSLRGQANADMDKHQFCTDSMAKSRQAARAASNAIDAKAAEMRWAEMAMSRLDDEIAFVKVESQRLEKAAAAIGQELSAEEARVQGEAQGRQAASRKVLDAVEVLTQLCGLNGAAFLSLVAGSEGKEGDCGEAAKVLKQAQEQIQTLGSTADSNLEKVRALFTRVQQAATEAADARKADLLAANVARGRRNDEFVVAKGELADKRKDLKLIEKAKRELETNCGPGQESHEERQARRQEEIDALKNALNVLSGQAVPTPDTDSLLETAIDNQAA